MKILPGKSAPEPLGSEIAIRTREIRLFTGLVLGAFLLTHFSNHALGLVSVEAMEAGRVWFNRLWRSPAGTVLLYGSVLTHFLLALLALYRRRSLRMPFREAAQLILGLSLPFLLVAHVVGTRVEWALTGHDSGYPEVVRSIWILNPAIGARQALALVIAWLHGCLGVYFWLRPKPWFPRSALILYTGALLVPVLALLGFAEAGRSIEEAPDRFGSLPVPPASDLLPMIGPGLYVAFGGMIAATLAARLVRSLRLWSRRVRIVYPGDQVVTVPLGFSVLEASRIAGIPHLSVCGGRGRCSTCRVRVLEGDPHQPPPTAQERGTLARIKAGPNVRLACQFRPTHDVSVVPILSTGRNGVASLVRGGRAQGQEQEIAVLFCDLRGFTSLAERRLPFDTVFILNRYFEAVGESVEDAGGYIDKFIGDGVLALFGLKSTPQQAARQALDAALRIKAALKHLNEEYESEFEQPLKIAMGLHAGPAIVGQMGYGQATSLTAVGDTINAASRLEGLAKELDVELVVSEDLATRAGLDLSSRDRQIVQIRGRAAPLGSWIIPEAGSLGR
ncbi:adenylate/guanylate cyclase domain-containing protein [Microvirga mediterraneensis]|uniref:Adenylate/guanylate cyclase domain-containing protein n=1 Tax=Microvirga mediterraneensis TaxID=2754695 RepID=A0A838BJA1_9HYPH|nr:adenylate/guanylate cyclase domain-containing protein [Microvirga mediterraneensis]MBA1155179.1 adenylate/guanylate cyclase domain-containing protein [Microvirga mediterraneensis]